MYKSFVWLRFVISDILRGRFGLNNGVSRPHVPPIIIVGLVQIVITHRFP